MDNVIDNISDIGIIGLGVMGENISRNFLSKGYKVSVYNHTPERTVKFSEDCKDENLTPCFTVRQFIDSLARPRKVLLMIKAGDPVDVMIDTLYPVMDFGDLIIDGGNSYYKDTERRADNLALKGRLFIGCGISGGEKGALLGPSLMPGGMFEGWHLIKEMFTDIAAKAPDGTPCCEWIGPGGSGHFVKMVHNAIEYADMQLISESYNIMKKLFGMKNDEVSRIFNDWNQSVLSSYLIEITAKILSYKDPNGEYLVDNILDVAGQKGTGKWSIETAMDKACDISVISASVSMRNLSTRKKLREDLSFTYPRETTTIRHTEELIAQIESALYIAKIIAYAQGFDLMQKVSQDNHYDINFSKLASIWRAGCIIRASLLEKIMEAYEVNEKLDSLLNDFYFVDEIKKRIKDFKHIVSMVCDHEIGMSGHTSAINYFYDLTSSELPINLIQAQRDYFGSHLFEKKDSDRGIFYHNNWE